MDRIRTLCLVLLTLAVGAVFSHCASPRAQWADSMRQLHHQGRLLEEQGRVRDAVDSYRGAAQLVPPGGSAQMVALRQDAYFSLGRAQFALGDRGDALATAEEGLALGQNKTVFVANLHGLRATILEALDRDIEALDDYGAALDIHELLLDRALALSAQSSP